ncbi:MAG: ABC transporter ATP-binding protein [Acidobacteria bacterium]|nr:ABC transporter ATP-binding protein [Acidobacteriota bacterium]
MVDSTPAVELEQVDFSYGATPVLHAISFTLAKGEIVGLLGRNGAGKSTTLKIIAGIQPPGAGTVRVVGLPLPERSFDVKQHIGYVPETAALFETLTGEEFLELSGRLHDVQEEILQERITTFLETFGLSPERSSRLDTYSKGMRQKILIAAALLHDPELILLDEPLTGLDVHAAILIKDLIAALAARGKTILYSSHVLDVVEKVCHRVLVIHNGRLLANGPVEALTQQTGQDTLESAFRVLTGTIATDPGVERIVEKLG